MLHDSLNSADQSLRIWDIGFLCGGTLSASPLALFFLYMLFFFRFPSFSFASLLRLLSPNGNNQLAHPKTIVHTLSA